VNRLRQLGLMMVLLCMLGAVGCSASINCDENPSDSDTCNQTRENLKRVEDQVRTEAERQSREVAQEAGNAVGAEIERRISVAWHGLLDRLPLIGKPSQPPPLDLRPGPPDQFALTDSPVPMSRVTFVNWYGNTEYAYKNRDHLYSELQGLHSGIDFSVPLRTPISSVANRQGTILSIDNKPFDFGAEPHNVLVDYGPLLVLYGHSVAADGVKVGGTVKPGDLVAYSDSDGALEHLHFEVIRKNEGWDTLPDREKAARRPGDVRTNPVPFLPQSLLREIAGGSFVWDGFHPTPTRVWQIPEDQPDISPGGPYLVP
jgi:murein DD-endopeptidase MepM/ murein hydrolase activator NlpD